MAIIITFTAIAHAKPEEDLEWFVLEGKTGDILLRETMEKYLEKYRQGDTVMDVSVINMIVKALE